MACGACAFSDLVLGDVETHGLRSKEELNADLFKNTLGPVKQVLEDSGVGPGQRASAMALGALQGRLVRLGDLDR